MSADTETGTEYAVCVTCGVKLATPDDARAHGTETLEAAKAANPDWVTKGQISGHAHRVVNPTPEELEKRRIRRAVGDAVDDALTDAIDKLWRRIDRGDVTEEEVAVELRHSYPDFADAWEDAEQ